jgi:RES domain-containing protein
MSIWFRAAAINHSQKVFSGEGGLYTAGRWNYLGRKIIYCSHSISLCTLEWLSHNGLSVAGFSYYRYSIEVPDNLIRRFTISQLPKGWDATPATDITRDFARKHLFQSDTFLAIALPSVLVPEEFNLVINPLHIEYINIAKSIKVLGKHVAPERQHK